VAFDQSDELDEQLVQAFSGIFAPPRLSTSVMRQVRTPAPTGLPEILDGIAWMGILSLGACVAFFVILK
jgi:hypothetical protein